jgi:hypothetical protein
MVRFELLIVVGCLLVAHAGASPLDDLRSPSQQVRDAAATSLRASYVPPQRSRWETVLAALQPGDSKDLVLQMLQPYSVTMEGRMGGGGSTTEFYRLDDLWLLHCCYGRSSELFACELTERMRYVWIEPPADFTGAWTTYFVNGRRSHELHYVNGRTVGTQTFFRSDGSTAVVQHQGADGAEGDDIGYFPSGAVSYRGQHRKGAQVGIWVWYNEDGSVRSTRDNPP